MLQSVIDGDHTFEHLTGINLPILLEILFKNADELKMIAI